MEKMEWHQKLPSSGPLRSALREKGQFWTPQWVAEAMIAFVTSANADHIFDPAVGAGAFFCAANRIAKQYGRKIQLLGNEIDPSALEQAKLGGLNEDDLAGVQIRDFVLNEPERQFRAIVANPPYIRHHRLAPSTKNALQLLAKRLIGKSLDGRTGYHIFFFLKALEKLALGGRLAFIMPADTCEGVFAPTLWKWILSKFRLNAVVTFSREATPFPSVDTNAMIFMVSAEEPQKTFSWCRCNQAGDSTLRQWVELGLPVLSNEKIEVVNRLVKEGLATGLSRPPLEPHEGPLLGAFVRVMRGVATGHNEFFFMTENQALSRGLPLNCMVRAVGRTRDIEGDELTEARLKVLDENARPTYLLSLDGRSTSNFPAALKAYLQRGEEQSLNKKSLIRQRRPWYKMETREPPPFLFAYLGRRNARFIRNSARAVPLTGFLCVYARQKDPVFIDKLWRLLRHPDTLSNLSCVAKSYGSGAIKVEPRALERTPISERALRESNLLEHNRVTQEEMAFM